MEEPSFYVPPPKNQLTSRGQAIRVHVCGPSLVFLLLVGQKQRPVNVGLRMTLSC